MTDIFIQARCDERHKEDRENMAKEFQTLREEIKKDFEIAGLKIVKEVLDKSEREFASKGRVRFLEKIVYGAAAVMLIFILTQILNTTKNNSDLEKQVKDLQVIVNDAIIKE
jgi:hypothetical protein